MADTTESPFSADQIASLTAYQSAGLFEPYRCERGDGSVMEVHAHGLVCPVCNSHQKWAATMTLDWGWKFKAKPQMF